MIDVNSGDSFSAQALFLREWRLDDAAVMVALFDTEQMNRWTPLASPFSHNVARAYVQRAHEVRASGTVQLAVCLEPDLTPVGEVMVFPGQTIDEVELAYAVGVDHQRRGVGTRAVRAALDLAHSRGARRSVLSIAKGNEASAAVARAAGFVLTDDPVRARRRKGFVLHMQTWRRELGTGAAPPPCPRDWSRVGVATEGRYPRTSARGVGCVAEVIRDFG